MGDLNRVQNSSPVQLTDDSANVASVTNAPAGTEAALIVRNIPYGTQPVSGTVTLSSQTVTIGATSVTQPVSGTVVASVGALSDSTSANSTLTTTAQATTAFALAGYQGVACIVTGAVTGTVAPQFSIDGGVTWSAANFLNAAGNLVSNSTAIGNFGIVSYPGGTSHVQLLSSGTWNSGTATVSFRATVDFGIQQMQGLGAAGTPLGGVVSIQGVTSGQAVIVSQASGSTVTVGALPDNTSTISTLTTTAQATTAFAIAGYQGVACIVTGAVTGTVAPQISLDGGATWSAAEFMNSAGNNVANAVTTGNYSIINLLGGTSHVRLLSSGTWNSGTATVSFRATLIQGVVAVQGVAGGQAMPISGTTGLQPLTSGGLTIYRVLSLATTNAVNIKNAAGQVYGWFMSNTNAAPRFVKLYNKATAPSVGTDVPVMTILLPGNASGAGTNVQYSMGIPFSLGIGIAITGVVTDADTTAVLANEVVVNLLYF